MEVSLYRALLIKLALEHSDAEDEKEERHGVECSESYAAVSVKDGEEKKHSVIDGSGKDNSADARTIWRLLERAEKIRPLEEAVILGRSAYHFTSQLHPFPIVLDVNFRSALFIIELDLIVNEFGVIYNFEKLRT